MIGDKLVSVVIITYNQENYISSAINGVLKQKVSFKYEIIIANDHSTDNTHNEIDNYINKKSVREDPRVSIKYFNHEKNIGMIPNFIFSLQQTQGKYIAICEGDDYWTDPCKLQKQVDFLENNSGFSITFHEVEELVGNKVMSIYPSDKNVKEVSTIYDLAKNNFIPTLSVVFRNNNLTFPDWMYKIYMGDYPLHLMNAEYGKIKFFPEAMGVYRKEVGVWSSEKEQTRIKKMLQSLFIINKHYKKDKKVSHNLSIQIRFYLYQYIKQSESPVYSIFSRDPLLKNVSVKNKLYIFLKILLRK